MAEKPEIYSRRDFLKTLGESVGTAAYLRYMAPLVPIIGASQSCKSPTEPEEQTLFRWRNVEVTYDRGPGPYPRPGAEGDPRLFYTLYDADPRSDHLDEMSTDEWIQGGYRQGHKRMEWIKEYVYKCTLKDVFIQTDEFNEPHSSYVRDGKLWQPENGVESTYTSEGVSIPGAVIVGYCKAGYTMYWKLV